MTALPVVDLVFAIGLLYLLLSSRRARPADDAPVLSGRALAGVAIAFAALFVPVPERRRSMTPPSVPAVAPQIAHEAPDAGADAAVPACVPDAPAGTHGALYAAPDEPLARRVHEAAWEEGGS